MSPLAAPSTTDRIRAISLLFAYWIGKPREAVEHKHVFVDNQITQKLEELRRGPAGEHLLAVAEALVATQTGVKS